MLCRQSHPDRSAPQVRSAFQLYFPIFTLLVRIGPDKLPGMIDLLESRSFLSVTPHAALSTLRADVADIGQTFNNMIVADNSAVANLQSDLSIFPTHLTSDNANLRLLNVRFRIGLSAMANDFDNIKVLFNRDINQLIADCSGYNRHPSAAAETVVEAAQQQLIAQGKAAFTTLVQDSETVQTAYQQALELIATSHSVDATLVARVSHISTVFASNVVAIQSAASKVAVTDIPIFNTALEPAGVLTVIPA
jgi:hypothetical protein